MNSFFRKSFLILNGASAAFFFSLCCHFEISTFLYGEFSMPVLILIFSGTFGLGFCSLPLSLLAFAFSVPTLSGLTYLGLPAPTFIFNAMVIGWITRDGLNQVRSKRENVTQSKNRHSSEKAFDSGNENHAMLFLIDWLMIGFFLSVAVNVAAHPALLNAKGTYLAFGNFPGSSPYYVFTAAFIWLQGLFFLKLAIREDARVRKMLEAILLTYAITLTGFWVLQDRLHLPFLELFVSPFSPYEETHAFTSVATGVLMFLICTLTNGRWISGTLKMILSALLMFFVIFSSNRISWIAVSLGLGTLALVRMPRKYFAALLVIGVAMIVIPNMLHYKADPNSLFDSYVTRFTNLVRFEHAGAKDPSRVNLYKRAVRMIAERPLTGHGIGSFPAASLKFSRSDEPYADFQAFAHNLPLQLAAEMGIPFTCLMLVLMSTALYRGFLAIRNGSSEALGLVTAVIAYLTIQMATHVFSTFVTQQYFFWFLIAALFSLKVGASTDYRRNDVSAGD